MNNPFLHTSSPFLSTDLPTSQKRGHQPIFLFDQGLDAVFLRDFYEGDILHASSMFEVFLNLTVQSFQEMQLEARRKNWYTVQQLAHKIAPTFRIVGLGKIADILTEIEHLSESSQDIELKLQKVNHSFQHYLPKVIAQKLAIDQYLSGLNN